MNADSGVDARVAQGRRRHGRQRPAHAVPGRPARRAGHPAEGRRDHGARRRLRGRASRSGFWAEVEDLRENWVEDKRWEPTMDADEARRVLQVLEEGRHQDLRLGRRRGLGAIVTRRGRRGSRLAYSAPWPPQTDVLVIGGGATGAGVACDAALRGFDTILVERVRPRPRARPAASTACCTPAGATWSSDPRSATECAEENAILRRIAADGIEDTGGLFVTTPDDDPAYADQFLAGCARDRRAGARRSTSPRRCGASRGSTRASRAPSRCRTARSTPGSCVGLANAAHDARRRILTYHWVTDILRDGDAVVGRSGMSSSVSRVA